jgi:hypothetical protein
MFVGKARSISMSDAPEKELHLGRLHPYSQTLDTAGKVCKRQTLELMTIIQKFGM